MSDPTLQEAVPLPGLDAALRELALTQNMLSTARLELIGVRAELATARDWVRAMRELAVELGATRFNTQMVDAWLAALGSQPEGSQDDIVTAQHDETGRMWTGPRSQLPRRYNVVPEGSQVAPGADWKNAAQWIGERISSNGPPGYYAMTAEQWREWAWDVLAAALPPKEGG